MTFNKSPIYHFRPAKWFANQDVPALLQHLKERMHRVSASPTLTEWLWKSVTTISFLLFTATKCGPGISRGDKKGGRERGKMSHPVFFIARQEVPRYFWAGLKKAQHGGDRETP